MDCTATCAACIKVKTGSLCLAHHLRHPKGMQARLASVEDIVDKIIADHGQLFRSEFKIGDDILIKLRQ